MTISIAKYVEVRASTVNSAKAQHYRKWVVPKQVHTSGDFTEITRTLVTFAVLRSTLKYIDVR
jgi:hypothetical protein